MLGKKQVNHPSSKGSFEKSNCFMINFPKLQELSSVSEQSACTCKDYIWKGVAT